MDVEGGYHLNPRPRVINVQSRATGAQHAKFFCDEASSWVYLIHYPPNNSFKQCTTLFIQEQWMPVLSALYLPSACSLQNTNLEGTQLRCRANAPDMEP